MSDESYQPVSRTIRHNEINDAIAVEVCHSCRPCIGAAEG
jgi:hypothetical protein